MSAYEGDYAWLSKRYRDAQKEKLNFQRQFQGVSSYNPGEFEPQYSDDIRGLLDRQISESEENRRLSEQDRERALGIMQGRLGYRSPEFRQTFDSLNEDPGDTPFAQMLRNSIQSTIENPDVYGQDQIDAFASRIRDNAGRAVQDALESTRVDAAQRGVDGGISQGNEQQLRLQAYADTNRQVGEMEFAASEARAQNLATAQQLGVSFESATQQQRTQRLQALSQFVGQQEANDLELVTGMAEILANTVRENPDYSGFASILSDMDQQAQDLLLQRENLAMMREQIRVSQEIGASNEEMIQNYTQQQQDYQFLIRNIMDQMGDIERRLRWEDR